MAFRDHSVYPAPQVDKQTKEENSVPIDWFEQKSDVL
jgi:hypothetical protein